MKKSTRRLTAFITAISGVIAFIIALGLPAAYWSLAYRAQVLELETEADLNAKEVTELVNANPDVWRLQLLRLQALVSEDHTRTDLPEHRALLDERGEVIAENDEKIEGFQVSRHAEVYDAGQVVATVRIARDLSPLMRETAGVGLIGLLLGVGVFVTLRLVPLRALDHAIDSLRAEKDRAEITLASIGDAVFTTDAQGRIAYLNAAALRMTGWTSAEALGKKFQEVVPLVFPSNEPPAAVDEETATAKSRAAVLVARNGKKHDVEYAYSAMRDAEGNSAGVAVLRDISERKRAEERMIYLAHYDGLTGLPNRNLFQDRIQGAVTRAERNRSLVALFHLDLDRFKHVNENLGHTVGDQLLKLVADRLRTILRNTDSVGLLDTAPILDSEDGELTLSRLGGDEFGVVAEGLQHAEQASIIGNRLLDIFESSFDAANTEVYLTPGIGIAIYPNDASELGELVKHAESAGRRSKELGGNNFQFYTQDMNDKVRDRLRLETGLRHALEQQQWELFYQPKIDLASGVAFGAEALLRWRHPDHGLVSPADFIPLLEETGLIVAVGDWVLRTACRQTAAWQREGLPIRNIAVNLSPRQFVRQDLRAQVAQALSESGLTPAHLELELTESMLMHDVEASIAMLTALKQMNVRLSIDDFGTGYSSLAYLKRFDIDTLKIDQSFVRDIGTSRDDAAIVDAVVALARSLRLKTVAEGVETEEQHAFLRGNGCDNAQGFLFSKPLPAAAFAAWMRAYSPALRMAAAGVMR